MSAQSRPVMALSLLAMAAVPYARFVALSGAPSPLPGMPGAVPVTTAGAKALAVSSPANTSVIKIAATDTSPEQAALLRGLAGKLTREQLNEFQELLNRQNEDLYLDQDAADDFFISLDNDFHRLLYRDSGYDRIWEAMHNVTSHMDRVRYLDSALCRGNIASVQKEHEQIFGYLRDGLPLDVDVEALFEHHLGMYRENFQKILERFPDFFVRT